MNSHPPKNQHYICSKALALAFALLVSALIGCQSWQTNPVGDKLFPSNNRDWTPELARLPFADFEGNQISLSNIRDCVYLTNDDYVVNYIDRIIDINQINSVDFVVVPFKNEAIAHTMLSFGLDDDSYLTVSVEIRTEKGEEYKPFLGMTRQFELTYVLATEQDLIRVRTSHRDADVYLYPTVATPEQAQQLFVHVLQRMNGLASQPEFYHSITNNCTTNIMDHVNEISPDRVKYNWKVLLPGFSPEHAYELGLLDRSVPFEDLRMIAYVNDLVQEYYDEPEFSKLIRSGRHRLSRLAHREQVRQATLESKGKQFLEQSQPGRRIRR